MSPGRFDLQSRVFGKNELCERGRKELEETVWAVGTVEGLRSFPTDESTSTTPNSATNNMGGSVSVWYHGPLITIALKSRARRQQHRVNDICYTQDFMLSVVRESTGYNNQNIMEAGVCFTPVQQLLCSS